MAWTVATFNVMNLLEPRDELERGRLDAKVDAVARTLLECDADVVALQEIGSIGLARALVAALPGAGYGEPFVGTADARGIRCALLSRLPVVDVREHTAGALPFPAFAAGDPPPFGTRIPLRRGVVHALVEAPHVGRVHVLSAHFKSRLGVPLRDAGGAELPATTARSRSEALVRSLVWRCAEALYVRGVVDNVLGHAPAAHVVFAGDLNDVPESPVLGAVRGEGHGPEAQLFDCTSRIPAESRFSVIHEGRGVQIDHALATAELHARVAGARFANADLRDHGPFVPGVPEAPSVDSDHAPLVVRFG
jgi:endonuclease/exonuclease/phosphatase family metal-dependent hydrolase